MTILQIKPPPLNHKQLAQFNIFPDRHLDNDDPSDVTPFQGFSFGWFAVTDMMRMIPTLQPDILEEAFPIEVTLARRITGDAAWCSLPISLTTLLTLEVSEDFPFWVVFSGTKSVARSVDEWRKRQKIVPLHVTGGPFEGGIEIKEFSRVQVREFVRNTLEQVSNDIDQEDIRYAQEQVAKWKTPIPTELPWASKGHFCTTANYMTLAGAGWKLPVQETFVAAEDEPYFEVMLEGVNEIGRLRETVGDARAYRLHRPQPSLILSAPSMFRHLYKGDLRIPADVADDPAAVRDLIKMLQRQSGFRIQNTGKKFGAVMKSKAANAVLSLRRNELEVHALAVGLRAASTLASTLRLRPAVNRVSGVLGPLVANSRAETAGGKRKFSRLFFRAQEALRDAVGREIMTVVDHHRGDIKLVSDVPLEWLPVRGVPLGIQLNSSRITSTPGNLMAGELVLPRIMSVPPEAFQKVLLLTSFASTDPIGKILPIALETSEKDWRSSVDLTVVEVDSADAFVDELNKFDGGLLIFDGHGNHDDDLGFGTLAIGNEAVDVWRLRGKVRVPPAVILSACDTHAAERSHATTANGFVSLGARAVLGTLLPISATIAAVFIARFMLRLAMFLPAAINGYGRALTWTEIVGGMIRMQYGTDLLRPFLSRGLLTDEQYHETHLASNTAINSGDPDWYNKLNHATAKAANLPDTEIGRRFQQLGAHSEMIKYVQLGNPETLLVATAELQQRFETDIES